VRDGGLEYIYIFDWSTTGMCRSQWPCGLRRGSSAVRLQGSWVRFPPGHGCLSVVSVVCCQVEVSAMSWSLVQRSPTECGVSQMCVIVKPRRIEEAQAHIGLSSHRKKTTGMFYLKTRVLLLFPDKLSWHVAQHTDDFTLTTHRLHFYLPWLTLFLF
jgi:hypothetical protein